MGTRLAELRQEAEWRKCQRNEQYFLQNYWHIAHPAHGRILFNLRDAQTKALEEWSENRYSLTLKARQIGWTTLVAAHQFWLAFFHSDQNIIDLSRTERPVSHETADRLSGSMGRSLRFGFSVGAVAYCLWSGRVVGGWTGEQRSEAFLFA